MAELRRDPVSGRWVVTGSQELEAFQEGISPKDRVDIKPCPFCPGNEHLTPKEICRFPSGAAAGPWQVRTFPSIVNVFHAEGDLGRRGEGMYDLMNNVGAHEIIVETPSHVKNLSTVPVEQAAMALRMYQERMRDLGKDGRIHYSVIFKNQRKDNPYRYGHAHAQLAALPIIPRSVKDELEPAKFHFGFKERCLFCDIIHQEREDKTRLVEERDGYLTFVPFAARFPFETWLIPIRHQHDFVQEEPESLNGLAGALTRALARLEKLLGDPTLNYTLHSAPYQHPREGYWSTIQQDYHWHLEILPQIAEVMGFEWGTGFHLEPLLPETCAKMLRETSLG